MTEMQANRRLLIALLVLPVLVLLARLPGSPAASTLNGFVSLAGSPRHFHRHLEYVLFVPLSAAVVSFFRLTLGLRVLGFFRPILIAIAFRTLGVPLGVLFLAGVLLTVTVLWPALRGSHYYARISILLSLMAMLLVLPMTIDQWWPAPWLEHVAYFPIIALCLVSDSFAKTLDAQGLPEAAWQALNTVLAAAAITFLFDGSGLTRALLRFPELLAFQIGIVLAIERFLRFELFAGVNPLKTLKTGSGGETGALALDGPA
jgi:uncharacterized protein with transglutaminase domain